jgi:hypothetical protein
MEPGLGLMSTTGQVNPLRWLDFQGCCLVWLKDSVVCTDSSNKSEKHQKKWK